MNQPRYARDYLESDANIGQLFDLSGRASVVTGGGAGIGRAIALGLARFGADVLVADLDEQAALEVAASIRAMGRRSESMTADVTNWTQVQEVAARADATFGHVDICVNSAGRGLRKSILDTAPEEWWSIVNLNLRGAWLVAKAFGALMIPRRRGKLILIASAHGHVADDGLSAYAPAKGGVVQLSRSLAVEWAPHNIQVNCISPGHTRTQRTRNITENPQLYEEIRSKYPTGRFAEPWELIGPAVFLASDASGFVTGHSLLVDGGFTAL